MVLGGPAALVLLLIIMLLFLFLWVLLLLLLDRTITIIIIPTAFQPHTPWPCRGVKPPSYQPPQGLAPYPLVSAHCHPLLPYYHIWSTATPLPLPYIFTLPHAPPARHAPFSMTTLRKKKRRMKRQGLSWWTICQGDEEWAGTQLRAAHWACGVSLNAGPSKGMESHE